MTKYIGGADNRCPRARGIAEVEMTEEAQIVPLSPRAGIAHQDHAQGSRANFPLSTQAIGDRGVARDPPVAFCPARKE